MISAGTSFSRRPGITVGFANQPPRGVRNSGRKKRVTHHRRRKSHPDECVDSTSVSGRTPPWSSWRLAGRSRAAPGTPAIWRWRGHTDLPLSSGPTRSLDRADPLRKWLITGMVTIWSLRLGTSLLFDVIRHHPAEGHRYVALRDQFPKRPWFMFFGFSQVPGRSARTPFRSFRHRLLECDPGIKRLGNRRADSLVCCDRGKGRRELPIEPLSIQSEKFRQGV